MLTRRHCLAAPLAALQTARRRPNIIVLLADDQRWDSLGCAGNPIVRTPNIDRLAAGGVRFTNHFVTTAICVTSRASIFSGQYASRHGIWKFSDQFTPAAFAQTYPALLRTAGYRTAFVGKYGLDGPPLPAAEFDYWRGFAGQGSYFPKGEPGPHLTTVMGDQAAEFLTATPAERPFFLQVSFKAPHVQDDDPRQFLIDPEDAALYRDAAIPVPKTADPRYIAMLPTEVQRSEGRRRWAVRFATPGLYRESVRNYYRLITGIDRQVGRLTSILRERGLHRDTIVVYTSDNGFYLSEHGLAGKWFMHEESIRVPLIVSGGPARAATTRGEMTLNIDLAPTLLRLAGLEPPAAMQGADLTPLLEARPVPWRKEWFYEHRFANPWIPKTEGIRTERWKYTRYLDTQPEFEELFDLKSDPLEETNLAAGGSHRETLEGFRSKWREARAAAR